MKSESSGVREYRACDFVIFGVFVKIVGDETI